VEKMPEREDIEKRIIVKTKNPKYPKEDKNPIEIIFYKNGSISLSDCPRDYWEINFVYLYPQQVEQLKKIFSK
jgi:hypothetical protein